MIETIMVGVLVGALSAIFGVIFWSLVGYRITAWNMKKEMNVYLKNELPHLLQSEDFQATLREVARTFYYELKLIISEDLGLKEPKDAE